jgi:hypothetical protein
MENKLSKAQVKKQLFWTNGCYRAALLEYFDLKLTKKQKTYNCLDLKALIREKFGFDSKDMPPEVHTSYMKRVLALSDKKLSLILRAFQEGKQYRSQTTIDAIMTELFERASRNEIKTDG